MISIERRLYIYENIKRYDDEYVKHGYGHVFLSYKIKFNGLV